MAPDSEGGVYIGIKEIYDEVRGTRVEIQSLSGVMRQVDADVKDHEKRIRKLEKLLWSVPLTAVAGIGAFLADVIHNHGK